MISWWLGRPGEGNRVEDDGSEVEPPETPAPVFAARALKSAIFGMPARVDDKSTIYDVEIEGKRDPDLAVEKESRISEGIGMSPTKLPGILLTPGTATSRRKTVSFGTEVVENKKIIPEKGREKEEIDRILLGNVQNPIESKANPLFKSTRLTRALENAKDSKSGRHGSRSNDGKPVSRPLLSSEPILDIPQPERNTKEFQVSNEVAEERMTRADEDGDMTMDLNEPHSQSGKYWKSEYEQYHQEANAEMKKLLKYKQLAKSYAKKKDAEALELSEKLKEEQRRVVSMEDKISKFSARIAASGLDGADKESPDMIKELARQTALAVQYRAQVEEFRAALEDNKDYPSAMNEGTTRRLMSPKTEQTLLDTQRELRKAREQLKEMTILVDEARLLKQNMSTNEDKAKKHQDENTKLAQELIHSDLRLQREVERSEKNRQTMQERVQRKDEALKTLQKRYDMLKEAAKSQRRDAEHILKRRHDQVVELKKQLTSLRGSESTAKDLEQALREKSAEHDRIVSNYELQIEQLLKPRLEDLFESGHTLKQMNGFDSENVRPGGSVIPAATWSTAHPSVLPSSTRDIHLELQDGRLAARSSHSALSELVNESNPVGLQQRPVEPTEPFLPSRAIGRTIPEAKPQPSPRPSMFNIPCSPPQGAMMRSGTVGYVVERSEEQATCGFTANQELDVASSRLGSLESSKTRGTIPPERAAAAKARLEKKNAEKKRAMALGVKRESLR